MRLLAAEIHNFGSYKDLNFSFDNQGLSLIYGDTGSGKSTLQDIPCWIMFGQTAKDGSVDDVRSWTALDEPTVGILELQINSTKLTITRVRGKPSQNDLYWEESTSDQVYRGKDISETQKLINKRLGVDFYTYSTSAYYNEFSPTGSFFTSKASDRRELFNKLANLELPSKLLERVSSVKKETRKTYLSVFESLNKTIGRSDQLKRTKITIERDAQDWCKRQEEVLRELKTRAENFDVEKAVKIKGITDKWTEFERTRAGDVSKLTAEMQSIRDNLSINKDKCEECGQPNKEHHAHVSKLVYLTSKFERTSEAVNPFDSQLVQAKNLQNNYSELLESEKLKSNPFTTQIDRIERETIQLEQQTTKEKQLVRELDHKLASLAQLSNLTSILRVTLLKRIIAQIETNTNKYLETYFDSELRVAFKLTDDDNLDITIHKSGHECSFKQLSKGQRSLLKLCFSVPVMKAASDKSGVHFNTLMFDESLDGLDGKLKIKAFGLFCELSKNHENILVIDHSEGLQSLFDNKFYVTINSDISTIK